VFACGPWLPNLFPAFRPLFTVTRQEVFFFGTPAGDMRFTDAQLPVWIDGGASISYYGIPGNHWRGFKVADDTRGSIVDPTSVERRISEEGLSAARAYLRRRFPAMAGAPLVEARVCQYENSTDLDFILDRHPEAENVWIIGGGSGHGFKHGPVVGEMVTDAVLSSMPLPPEFSLRRFATSASHHVA
jgi:sarcosine oxidase